MKRKSLSLLQWTMERNLVLLWGSLGLLCCSILVLGCASAQTPQVLMNVRAYPDPEYDLAGLKRFDIVQIDSLNPLLEKQLLFLVSDSLVGRGYIHDKAQPEFLVALSQYCGRFSEYVPPQIVYVPVYSPGTTTNYSGYFGNTYVSGQSKTSGILSSVPVTTGGGTITQFYRSITLFFVDRSKLGKSESLPQVWTGTADSEGSTSDILLIAPYLVSQLLGEFPTRSGLPSERVAKSLIGQEKK